MDKSSISTQTIRRLPVYLDHLRTVTTPSISATAIAQALELSEIQVRKDLASVTEGGRPGVGYDTGELASAISHYLGYDSRIRAALVGAGNLGRALAGYDGFARCGLDICAAFDISPEVCGEKAGGAEVLPVECLSEYCRENGVQMGIITVPASQAQSVCDALVSGGVHAVWNFTRAHLIVPEDVMVQNENLVASFAVLSRRLSERLENDHDQYDN